MGGSENAVQNPAQVAHNACSIDADLARIVQGWPTLADPIRRAMLALLSAGDRCH